jgi:hypothetical protein
MVPVLGKDDKWLSLINKGIRPATPGSARGGLRGTDCLH